MTKILLVEDDDNLRGIYGDRLMAEGYEIAAARDGEEALAMAVNEKPDLIISDVMMPKISGFDMLDILRSTAETKDTKVIMMTALSQKEDQERGERLGANRYLVKSQVTLEDVVRVAAEVLAEDTVVKPAPVPTPAPAAETPAPTPTAPAVEPDSEAVTAAPDPVADELVAEATSAEDEKTEIEKQIEEAADIAGQSTIESTTIGKSKVVEPVSDMTNDKPDINELYKEEMAKEQAGDATEPTPAEPAEETPPTDTAAPESPPPADGPNPNDISL